jgi:hypothetical protein
MPQKKEHFTSSNKKNKNINLMKIQYDAATSDNYTTNSTDTEQLKNKLLNILKYGGSPPELVSNPDYAQNYDPAFDPATNTEHTDIIYTCCLIDLNLVTKLAQLIKGKQRKTTRIYININPFNIWGSAINGIAFGELFYKARRYLHELFIEGGLLDKSFPVSTDDTYETSIVFIKYLQTKNIILFDSPDFKIRPFLYGKEESITEIVNLIEKSTLLKEPEDKQKLKTFVEKEKGKGMTMTLPYEWYKNHLPLVKFTQSIENHGLKKIIKYVNVIKGSGSKLENILKMIDDYNKNYIAKFKEEGHFTDPIRSIEHKRIILELIDKHFPIEPKETEESLLNRVLKIFLRESNVDKMKLMFKDDKTEIITTTGKKTCAAYVNELDKSILENIPRWFSVYYFSMFGPKLFHDFSGLLFTCTNLSNKDILKPNDKIFDGEKLQLDIIERCKTLKEEDEKKGINSKKMHNGYIVDIIRKITDVHTNLENVTIIADMEGDDASAIFGAYFYFPEKIKLNVIIQQSTGLRNPSLVLSKTASFKDAVLQEFCDENALESSLLTIHYMIEFLMSDFTQTYTNRTTYDYINIDYFSRTEIIRNLFTKEKQDTTYSKLQKNIILKVEEDTRDFEFFDKTKQEIIPGISPNICKVAELLLEMCKPDKVKTAELVKYIKQNILLDNLPKQMDDLQKQIDYLQKQINIIEPNISQLTNTLPTDITRKYLKKNIY